MSRSGIKCLGNIIRSTSRITNQVRPEICRNMANDMSKRKLCTLAGLKWNVDVLSTKLTNNSVTKSSYSSPMVIGSLSTIIKPLLMETSDSSSSDMLECLGGDDDSDTWSYI